VFNIEHSRTVDLVGGAANAGAIALNANNAARSSDPQKRAWTFVISSPFGDTVLIVFSGRDTVSVSPAIIKQFDDGQIC
jgi:hypothetical protein